MRKPERVARSHNRRTRPAPPKNVEPTIVIEKAHDVRHLRGCDHCSQIGDDRYMPKIPDGKTVHGFCALSLLGKEGLTRLPNAEQRKLTLAEIGVPAMKLLVERWRESKTKRST